VSETFFALQHFVLGCQNPACNFIYTQDEILSAKFKERQKNHRYCSDAAQLYALKLKIWNLQEILAIKEIKGWSPSFSLILHCIAISLRISSLHI